ncbi:P-loop NTPase [Metallosphaera javensis (ex Sakai et al. 2022)]|uniref:P-loop NTPase n=1 Tax=Metallosphaera javensis (ex Sakai et al. 2022) TaxID=2775498 RepID=UPI00258799F3|nr:MAG: iron-sulfur cluster carrier protein [Metallosphaera javensis (ex Sakai et al. 2022)]
MLLVSIHSIKGGVGKSTIAVSLAKVLASEGYHVFFKDKDVVGYASYLAGILSPGLVTSLVDDMASDVIRDITVGKGSITILKYYGDGPRYQRDIEKIHSDKKLLNQLQRYIEQLLARKRYSLVIIDNPPAITPNNEAEACDAQIRALFPQTATKYIIVSDGHARTIEDNIHYAKLISSQGFDILAFIINMVEPQSKFLYESEIKNITAELKCKIGVIIPFQEELFQFDEEIKDFPIPQQVKELAKKMDRDEMGIIA